MTITSTNKSITQDTPWGVGELAVSGYTEATGEATSSPMPQGASSFWRPSLIARHRKYAELRAIWGQGLRASPSSGGVVVGTAPGEQGTESPHYLELVAKRSADLDTILAKVCPGYWLMGSCENGHRYAKELYCGREWCEVCGAEWSAAHQRRFARWVSKATQIKTLGYFVFTIPDELRAKYRRKKALADLGGQVVDLLKSYGYSRGLRRWHFFGDKSRKWNPHLNCLVDGHYIPASKLDRIKAAYARVLGVEVVDIYYRYQRSPGQKVHTLKYVTRATFLDWHWDSEMALELHGFRNQLWWGSKLWCQDPSWSLSDLEGAAAAREDIGELDARAVESLESGICPHCGKPIDWGRVQPIEVLQTMDKRPLGAGYWELESVRAPPGRMDFSELEAKGYWRRVLARCGVIAS
ncbi:hypothetical protein ES703_79599 [subsurface metagenome]